MYVIETFLTFITTLIIIIDQIIIDLSIGIFLASTPIDGRMMNHNWTTDN